MKSYFIKAFLPILFFSILLNQTSCKKNNTPPDSSNKPVIESVLPLTGKAGDTITITGKNFSSLITGNQITINGVQATVISATSTTIQFILPQLNSNGNIILSINNQTITGPAITIQVPPSITGLSPQNGYVEDTIIISGNSFSANPSVFIGDKQATVISSTNSAISVRIPSDAKTDIIKVVTNGVTLVGPVFTVLPDVYCGGWNYENNLFVPKYWKNGKSFALQSSGSISFAVVNSICVSGTDIFAVGKDSDNENHYGTYWKNNQPFSHIFTGSQNTEATSVFVNGTDVHIVGYELHKIPVSWGFWNHYIPKYWKNGISYTLESYYNNGGNNIDTLAYPRSVYVSGNDVYIAGQDFQDAVYWKNGSKVCLTNNYSNLSNFTADARAIFVKGNDIYVAGSQLNSNSKWIAKYWKNGQEIILDEGSAMAIYVNQINDVYVAGYGTNPSTGKGTAMYWKNGHPVYLTNGNNTTEVRCMAVDGNDVYVGGMEYINPTSRAKYWKNGVEVSLPNGRFVNSIFVVPH